MTAPVIRAGDAGPAGARILSVGAYRPERVVDNDEICQFIDSSDTWIRERSGIVQRHRAAAGETVVDMAEHASRVALARAGLTGGDVDAVIVATVTHFFQVPSAAADLAHRLDTPGAMAIDVSAACSGFCHGVGLAADMIRSGSAGTVLVVGSEVMSTIIDPTDRGSAFIFGDGAGAVLVTGSAEPLIGPTVWGSDGAQWDLIRQDVPWDQVVAAATGEGTSAGGDVVVPAAAIRPSVSMAGPAVFRWAVWEMAPVARKALDAAGIGVDDLAAFVPHQANVRIIDALAKQVQLPAHVTVARDIRRSGNTTAASVPLAMDALLADDPSLHDRLALLIGFGAGLAYAAQVVRLPPAPVA